MQIQIPALPSNPKKAAETVALFTSDFIRGLGYSPLLFFLRLIIYENGRRPAANVSAEFSQRKRDDAVAAYCKRAFGKIKKPEAVAVKFYWSDPDLSWRVRDYTLKGE